MALGLPHAELERATLSASGGKSMSAGRYVDSLVFRVVACTDGDHPLPEAIEQAWQTSVDVSGSINGDELVGELEEELHGRPFELDEHYGHLSWGAEGAFLEIVIGVTSGTAVLVIDRLLGAANRRAARRPSQAVDAEEAAEVARRLVAKVRALTEEGVSVEEIEPLPAGFRVRLRTRAAARFVVETDATGSVYRLTRQED
jgi:hypothetical protein